MVLQLHVIRLCETAYVIYFYFTKTDFKDTVTFLISKITFSLFLSVHIFIFGTFLTKKLKDHFTM